MEQQVEKFMADLLSTGMSHEHAVLKGYEYAIALQMGQQAQGAEVSASMMERAALLVKQMIPGSYRNYGLSPTVAYSKRIY